MRIGFLLGAGFSKALHNEMPVMEELLSLLQKAVKIPEYIPTSAQLDLEQTLSYLWTNYPWHTEADALRNRIDYLTLVRNLHRILSEKEFDIWRELFADQDTITSADWRVRLAFILSQHDRSVVLTMNYDTLLERLMIVANQNRWLLYPTPIQRLSSAWNQQQEIQAVSETATGIGNFMPALYKLHGCLSWYSLNGLDENSIVYGLDMGPYYVHPQDPVPKDFSSSLFPIIVPPVADKASMYSNKFLRSQWIGALDGLRQCEELYCVGYSFPKSDLAMQLFLAEACSTMRTVHLVAKTPDSEIDTRVKNILDATTTVNGIYGSDCVEQMTHHLLDSGL